MGSLFDPNNFLIICHLAKVTFLDVILAHMVSHSFKLATLWATFKKKMGDFLLFLGYPVRGAKIPTFDFYLFVYFRFNFTENRETSRIS
jgi:hypothetical protein